MPFQPLNQDQPNVIVRCRNCQAQWLIYQQQLGLPLPCPSCHSVGQPQYQGTGGGAGSGAQVSFGTFRQLISRPDTSAEFIGLVERLLDLRHEGDLRFVDASGHEVGVEEVHYRIQSNAKWQGMLYNRYMNIAR